MPKPQSHPLLGKKIFMLVAHPDDETYLAAGTIHQNTKAGGSTVIACGSMGEKGTSHLARPLTIEALKRVRHQELLRAAKLLGVRQVHRLNFPDGQLMNNRAGLFRETLKLLLADKPEVLMSFGPDGYTGHHDHVTVYEVACRLAQRLGVPLYTFTVAPRLARRIPIWLLRKRRSNVYQEGALRYRKPSVKISVSQRVKMQALRCHASQIDGKNPYKGFPKYAVQLMTTAEYFALDRTGPEKLG